MQRLIRKPDATKEFPICERLGRWRVVAVKKMLARCADPADRWRSVV
jgi:hypothetical protein